MEKHTKNIDDLFKEELGNYAETPPPQAWDALEKRLSGLPPAGSGLFTQLSKYLLIVSAAAVLSISVSRRISGNMPDSNRNNNIADASVNNIPTNNITTNNQTAGRATVIASPSTPSLSTGNNSTTQPTTGNNTYTSPDKNTHTPNNTIGSTAARGNSTQSNTGNKNTLDGSAPHSNPPGTIAYNNNSTATRPTAANSRPATNSLAARANATAPVSRAHSHKSKKPGTHPTKNSTGSNTNYAATNRKENNDGSAGRNLNPEDNSAAAAGANAYKVPERTIYQPNVPTVLSDNTNTPQLPGTFKETKTIAEQKAVADPLMKKNAANLLPATKLSPIEVGIKAGFEGGVSNSSGKKIVVSPYVQYNLSSKISLMVQTAIKYAHVNTTPLSGKQSFYKENNDSSAVVSSKVPVIETVGDTFYVEKVTYSQSHDSIVKTYTTGGAYMEFELPILMKYAVSKNCSFYGGFTMAYSTYVGITEHTYVSGPINESVTGSAQYIFQGQSPTYNPVSSEIIYKGNEIASYKGPLYITPAGGLFHMGYMLGFNYAYNKRWLFDVLMQQAAARSAVAGGYNTNAPFSAPYFRITLGYKLF